MYLENMPFCCTSAVLGSFGEHGEPSIVTVEEVKRLLKKNLDVVDLGGVLQGGHKRCVFAISVDPKNIRVLLKAGFREIDSYQGIQGIVRIFSLHVGELKEEKHLELARHMLEEGQV